MSEASAHHAQGKEVGEGYVSIPRGLRELPKIGVRGRRLEKSSPVLENCFVGLAQPDSLWLYFKPTESN